jgi:hypothetical protein
MIFTFLTDVLRFSSVKPLDQQSHNFRSNGSRASFPPPFHDDDETMPDLPFEIPTPAEGPRPAPDDSESELDSAESDLTATATLIPPVRRISPKSSARVSSSLPALALFL